MHHADALDREARGDHAALGGAREALRGRAHVLPEDWNFSGWCARKGLRVFATRKVSVGHHGTMCYTNDGPWGAWDTDQGD